MSDIHEREHLPLTEQLAGIDLNLVVAFDALAREGSVTSAARSVGVTQSAMSHSLRRLRDLLGDPVFVRAGNTMVLTRRAEALVVPLRSGLVTLARALSRPAAFEPSAARRTFRLASPDLFDVLAMPPLLARLGREAPSVEIKIVASFGRAQSERLATGEIDLAIAPRFDRVEHAPAEPEGSGLLRRTLFRDRFVCLLRADHPALRGKRARKAGSRISLPMETYLTLAHALVSPRGEGPGPVDEALAKHGHRRRVAISVPQFTSALAIVARSDIVLTAPSALAVVGARGFGVVALAPPTVLALPEHSITMVWHERFTNDPGHRWLREVMQEVAAGVEAELPAVEGGPGAKMRSSRRAASIG